MIKIFSPFRAIRIINFTVRSTQSRLKMADNSNPTPPSNPADDAPSGLPKLSPAEFRAYNTFAERMDMFVSQSTLVQ